MIEYIINGSSLLSSSFGTTYTSTSEMQKDATRTCYRLGTDGSSSWSLWKWLYFSNLHLPISYFFPLPSLANFQLVHHPLLPLVLTCFIHSKWYHFSRLVTHLLFSVQYEYLFDKMHTVSSIFLLYSIIFYVVAIPMSHFAYKVFKSQSGNPFAPQQRPDDNDQN